MSNKLLDIVKPGVVTGADVQKLIDRIYATPADIVDLLRKASTVK